MFKKLPVTTSTIEGVNELESKYKVAQILTSMQSTSGLNPTASDTPQFITTTAATPIFTPVSSSKSFEQSLLKLQTPQNRESGFVPPVVVEPGSQMPVMVQIKSELDYDTDYSSVGSESEYGASSSVKRARYEKKMAIPEIDPQTYLVANSRRPTGPRKMKKDESLSVEEEEKRKMRRERNKQAAAKCRKKREDVTNVLIVETENLEEQKNELENEIFKLQQQKEQYEFLLEAHKNSCQFKAGLQHMHAPPKTTATMTYQQSLPQSVHPQPFMTKALAFSSRPTSLQITASNTNATTLANVTEALGIPISTPSAGVFGFDTMADGHTGLTPLTQFPVTSINTPVASSISSCSGQVQNLKRKSTDSSSSNDLSSPTLMAL